MTTWYRVEKRSYRAGEIVEAEVVKETPKRIVTKGFFYGSREDRHDKGTWDYQWFNDKGKAEAFALEVLTGKEERLESDLADVREQIKRLQS